MMRYICANTVSGVFEIDSIDMLEYYGEVYLLSPAEFLEDLPTVDDGETIFTAFQLKDVAEWNKLVSEYTVSMLPIAHPLFDEMGKPDWEPNLELVCE